MTEESCLVESNAMIRYLDSGFLADITTGHTELHVDVVCAQDGVVFSQHNVGEPTPC
jgi:hypothetical protein